MAKRPSVKDILEAARKAGAAKPEDAPAESAAPESEPEAEAAAAPEPAPKAAAAPRPAANVPTPQALGRPLTLKEKLAAARAGAGGAAAPSAQTAEPAEAEVASGEEPSKSVPPPAPSLGRPMTLQEKLAAARGGKTAGPAAGAPPAAAKPAAAKPASAAKAAGPKRELPPLDKITDPKDLAEALRQTGEKKAKELAAGQAKPATAAKPGKEKESKPSTVLPRPSKAVALASLQATRRLFTTVGGLLILGWAAFVLGLIQFNAMLVRFMFPNVLAEPPSTIKIGLPSDYEAETVNERFKAEAGFWVVRSSRYNGQDILYVLKSVCTHLGCPPNWLEGEQKFKCPCHGSGFYISGVNFEGPAPRPLERFKVALADDGQILVDKSQIFQEELGQWTDPDSFLAT